MIVGKTFRFESAHYLPNHSKCGQMHGHTYHLTVEVEGMIDSLGFVIDFHELSRIVNDEVIAYFDHRNLNTCMTCVPTCENLVKLIYEALLARIPALHSVTLQEGEGGYARLTR